MCVAHIFITRAPVRGTIVAVTIVSQPSRDTYTLAHTASSRCRIHRARLCASRVHIPSPSEITREIRPDPADSSPRFIAGSLAPRAIEDPSLSARGIPGFALVPLSAFENPPEKPRRRSRFSVEASARGSEAVPGWFFFLSFFFKKRKSTIRRG